MKAHASAIRIPRGDFHIGINVHFHTLHWWGDGSISQRRASVNVMLGIFLLHASVESEYPKTLARWTKLKDNPIAASQDAASETVSAPSGAPPNGRTF